MLLKRCIFTAPLSHFLGIIFTAPLSTIALFGKIIGAVPFCIKNRTKCRSLHSAHRPSCIIPNWPVDAECGLLFWGWGGARSISFFGVHFMVKLLKMPTAGAGYKFWKIGNRLCLWQFSLGWSPPALPPPADPRAYGTRIHDPLHFYSYKLGI